MKPILNKLYKKGEIHPSWIDLFFNSNRRVALPTRFCISKPMFLVPDYARMYFSDFAFYKGEVLTVEELREFIKGDKNFGKMGARGIQLAEQYYDLGPGSDGIGLQLLGYRFIILPEANEKDLLIASTFNDYRKSAGGDEFLCLVYESDWLERNGLGKNPYVGETE